MHTFCPWSMKSSVRSVSVIPSGLYSRASELTHRAISSGQPLRWAVLKRLFSRLSILALYSGARISSRNDIWSNKLYRSDNVCFFQSHGTYPPKLKSALSFFQLFFQGAIFFQEPQNFSPAFLESFRHLVCCVILMGGVAPFTTSVRMSRYVFSIMSTMRKRRGYLNTTDMCTMFLLMR